MYNLNDNGTESEYLQSQEDLTEFYGENISTNNSANKVIFIKNKENLVLKFDGIPEKKIRKRLGDFKFKWNIKKQCWEGNKNTYNTVLKYLSNNTVLKIITQ